ncbi:peptidase [Actinomadura logoneensis]|uniref:Peptidase n=1 Tax=Actinomadura logoneensis TaxID=2293572 RepID=A0A372JKG8_9ACTN|nr:M64 family metallopeptidase [Actinomadura logoneensis]RFU40440.1 peptidase [Actinomadura logoneensis]
MLIRAAAALAAAIIPLSAVAAVPPARADGPAATVVPVQVTGDPAKRFNLVVLGDGYTEADMPAFRQNVDKHLNVLWSIEPYKSYRSYINVYRVEIPSKVSGVSCDPGVTDARKDTPLGMSFWSGCRTDGIQRLLVMDDDAANRYAGLVKDVPAANRQILALANSTTYGGAGGTYATASGGNAMSALISPHELGHSVGGLDDEYDYYYRGVPGGTYTGGEPESIHHTLLTEDEMRQRRQKWWRWLGERSEAGGTIGRHEGGLYHSRGVWRPSEHSIMKRLGYYYDQVGRERMTQAISRKVDLVQDATPEGTVGADRVLWLETLHPVDHALRVAWTVDGRPVRAGHDLDLRTLRLKRGTHRVTVRVDDPTAFIRDPAVRASFAQTRTWTVDTSLRTPPDTTAPGFTTTTPTDRPVGAHAVIAAETTHPATSAPRIEWRLDGRRVRADRDLRLPPLRPGTHRVTATVGTATRTWTVDATPPTVTAQAEQPPAGDRLTLKLTPSDDRSGYVVAEFRVDGDGWYNYFGWPTDSTRPFLFTKTGTNIDDLIYGRLAAGRHTIEYRAIDAAGNAGKPRSLTAVLR